MKISKRTREKAVLALSIAANEPPSGMAALQVVSNLGLGDRVWSLVRDAHCCAYDKLDDGDYELACAEAECLLREGWTP